MANKINTFKRLLFTPALLFTALTAFATIPDESEHRHSNAVSHSESPKEKKFNAGELIIGHITDAHDWHIAGEGDNSISLPLPVIVYSSERGLDIFLSNKFEHGHKTFNGYMLEHNNIVAVNEMESVSAHEATINEELTTNLWDISITKNVVAMFFSIALMLWMFISVARTYARTPGKAPKGMQSLLEPLIVFVRDDIAKSAIGEKRYKRYLPFLLTVFFFLWINNLMGLIPILPGGANLTGNIAIGLTLAAIVFIITLVTANKNYWRHIIAMPGVPIGVLVLLTPIEIFGMFLKPFVLMIRLFANMMAGHIIALSFFSLIFIFAEMNTGLGWGVGVFSVAFTIFMGMLELLVAFLQAYVFTLLAAMYFGAAIDEGHDPNNHVDDHAHDRNF
ncbi:MAG: F0F1 ATP synthase subunit A [Bacteroidetes bacterium]|nr:F0F1 ATP synthase subunit A [Bacteroidota bacterium]